ncbi:hypothetical protein REC12_25015 [Desulfosporosinus sp. PR]|uniref:hypothetical protein n=1 Tax=Candidatus Desulfosporosinus nitrosoreducens TaxID=3401928 RepID=UPI0027FC7E18|nr:hypothetical protein [Desulfosporosinus sp. PR]MDQ7096859.1 hypothetical protein [Desulfosporosinus sp. PR]
MAKRKWSFEEVEEYRRAHNQYFIYYNKDDANFLVAKMSGLGRTNNWAHLFSGDIIFVCLALMAYRLFLK